MYTTETSIININTKQNINNKNHHRQNLGSIGSQRVFSGPTGPTVVDVARAVVFLSGVSASVCDLLIKSLTILRRCQFDVIIDWEL